jgi:hypothetical protein
VCERGRERGRERTLENQFDVRQVLAMDQVGTTGARVINLFYFSPMLLQNKLVCLSLFSHRVRHTMVLQKYQMCEEYLSETNTQAYFAAMSVMVFKKVLSNWNNRLPCYKTFSSVTNIAAK